MQFLFNEDANLYDCENGDKQFEFPANIKQMGGIDNDIRIYVEDYVYTYLYQYAKTGGNKEKLAVLVGRHDMINSQRVIVISGAIQGKASLPEKGVESFTEASWDYITTQMEIYFRGLNIVGWVHTQPGFGACLMPRDEEFHKSQFNREWQIFYTLDPVEKTDAFYVYSSDKVSLKQAEGYFVYYEKNDSMQEYMINNSFIKPRILKDNNKDETKKGIFWFNKKKDKSVSVQNKEEPRKVSPEERIDAAAKIRDVLNKKQPVRLNTSRTNVLAGVSVGLCVVCLMLSLGLFSNQDKIKKLEADMTGVKSSYISMISEMNEIKTAEVYAAGDSAFQETGNVEEPIANNPETDTEMAETPEEVISVTSPEYYIVEEGDTLMGICRDIYGDTGMIASVMEVNGIKDPNKIYYGKKLILP